MLDAFGVPIVVSMSRAKRRKMRPEPPKHFWLDVDGCWFCKKKNACGGCKVIKTYIAEKQRTPRKVARDEKRFLDNS